MLIQTNNNPGQGSHFRNECGGFCMATTERPSPGSHTMEIWKDIEGYEGVYQVSSLGRMRSCDRIIDTIRWEQRLKGRILKLKANSNGYLCKKIRDKGYRIHRLVAEAFIPNPENKLCVNHKNGIKIDNRIYNLEWVTHSENMYHSMENGLHPRGENVKTSKLTQQQVLEIRELYKTGKFIQKDLAEKFNVTRTTIYKILNNKTWNHISN